MLRSIVRNICWCFLLLTGYSSAQDTIVMNPEITTGRSIADRFHIYTFNEDLSLKDFDPERSRDMRSKMSNSVENFDFTAKTYFIDFVLINRDTIDQRIVLETARPITNEVFLRTVDGDLQLSGDAIPFKQRAIPVQESAFPILLKAGAAQRFVLRIKSDGESLTIPMRFWDNDGFYHHVGTKWFVYGIYYGIFLFVILIYFTFYIQLKDRLFLTYSFYVFFSGFLQFALDGYMYRFIFPNGGYWADHAVIIVAGIAVFFALRYASSYLGLRDTGKRIIGIISGVVLLTILISLFEGWIMELSYVLINLISLIAVLTLLVISFQARKRNPNISPLYLIGILALLTGAIIFILGNSGVFPSIEITQYGLKAGALTETVFLSILMAGKYKALQKEKEEAQRQLVKELEEKNKFITESNVRLEEEVKQRTQEIEQNRQELKDKNEDLLSSIKYAERLQQALLTDKRKFQSVFKDSFIFFRPRDIVSGDFFWADEIKPNKIWPKGLKVFAVADCTGHGVPGAFVSIVCNNLLKLAATSPEVNYPGEALELIDKELQIIFNKDRSDAIKDGMDVSLVAIDPDQNRLYFSGARNSLLISREGQELVLEATKRSVGYTEDATIEFTTTMFQLQNGDMVFAFSDGFPDQFGGEKEKKYLSKRLRSFLCHNSKLPMSEQESVLSAEFEAWKGRLEQIDDVLVVGVLISS